MSEINQIFSGLHNRRILVVDDNPLVAQYIAECLAGTYTAVEHVSDPKLAIDTVLSAIATSESIDSMVLDLDIPEMNGIELLKQLNMRGVNLPTVIFSGEQGDHLAVPVIHQLNKAQNKQELDALVKDIATSSKGIPITYLRKFEGMTPMLDLTNALDAMGLVASQNQATFDDFLSKITPILSAYHFDNPHIAQMADIVKLTRVRFMELKHQTLKYKPFMKKEEAGLLFSRLDWWIADLEDDKFTAQALSDPDQGRSNIHLLQIYYNPSFIERSVKRVIADPAKLLLSDFGTSAYNSELIGVRNNFIHDHLLLVNAFEYHRLLSRDYSVRFPFDIEQQVTSVVSGFSFPYDVAVETNYQARDRDVNTEPYLTAHLVKNVLMNALEAAQGSAKKKVYIETSAIPISSLGDTEGSFFKSHGYPGDNEVVQVLIEDPGCGIPQENLEKVTQDGFSTKGSTGYGLAFVHQKIGEVPGAYRIESIVGVGTKFYLYFPVHTAEGAKQ